MTITLHSLVVLNEKGFLIPYDKEKHSEIFGLVKELFLEKGGAAVLRYDDNSVDYLPIEGLYSED